MWASDASLVRSATATTVPPSCEMLVSLPKYELLVRVAPHSSGISSAAADSTRLTGPGE